MTSSFQSMVDSWPHHFNPWWIQDFITLIHGGFMTSSLQSMVDSLPHHFNPWWIHDSNIGGFALETIFPLLRCTLCTSVFCYYQVEDGQGLNQDSEGSNEGQWTQRLGRCLWFIKKRFNTRASIVIGSIHPQTINRWLWTPLGFEVVSQMEVLVTCYKEKHRNGNMKRSLDEQHRKNDHWRSITSYR